MPLICQTEFVALDFESAGAMRGATDEPVQIGWAAMRGTKIDPGSLYCSYLRAGRPITWAAQKVHGITLDHLAGAPSLAELWPQVRSALTGKVVVAHGAGTEKRFLRAFPFHGFGPWIDTVGLARRFVPGLSDYSLSHLCDALGLTPEVSALCPSGRWHHALYDSLASLLIVRRVVTETGLADSELAHLSVR